MLGGHVHHDASDRPGAPDLAGVVGAADGDAGPTVRRVAVLSMHTSPLAQPGTGDGGGMNVYVLELAGALARAGVECTVYTRRTDPGAPTSVAVEPGLVVRHIDAGPPELPKEALAEVVDEFATGVAADLEVVGADLIHANYWLSGMAGHDLKHALDLPLVCTFHTLARVKAVAGDHEPPGRAEVEARIIGCADAILASCDAERDQLVALYGADPDRIEIVPPGVDHAFFSPGDRRWAREALGLDPDVPVVLFVGRIQPLKGLTVAAEALARLRNRRAVLVAVGGPSGPEGLAEQEAARRLVRDAGIDGRFRIVPPQPHHMLSSWYRAADVVVVPSRSESFGLVALEAAACGVPVVASAVGGLTTLVDHGVTGFLLERRDPAELAARVDALLADPALSARMGEAAAERARRYRWATAAARLRRLYADLTATEVVTCM